MIKGKLQRPSPAFVLAAIALFVSLGGSGYAASQLNAGASKKTPPLTKAQVNKLIGKYVNSHRSELRGATGAQGAAGAAGDRGPVGLDAIPIALSDTSATVGAQTVATAGPWTVTMTCPGGGPATLTVKGPGTIAGTTSIASGGAAGSTFVGGAGPIGGGANSTVGSGAQMSLTDFLQSGSTMYELHVVLTASNGGLFENCAVLGDAIPVS